MTLVKICGMTTVSDIRRCAERNVPILGLIVEYPRPVPWNLTCARARVLMEAIVPPVRSCMVVGERPERVLHLARTLRPSLVQLHGDETAEQVQMICKELHAMKIRCVKALRVDAQGTCAFERSNLGDAIEALKKTDVDALLLDAYTKSLPGGTGVQLDVSVYRVAVSLSRVPVVLAGGIRPDNLADVLEQAKPYAVDVLTGVEREPGKKGYTKSARVDAYSAIVR